MDRRSFIESNAILLAGLSLSCRIIPVSTENDPRLYLNELLQTWCDGMMAHQINSPSDPARHGALLCPSCNTIHGRCIDAVYPFMHMYANTKEEKYLTAAINVFTWEQNVSQHDGSWTVMPDPKTWKGISVFGAIALAETLYYYGDLLPIDIKSAWYDRLEQVGKFIHDTFDMTFTNINYGYSAVYGMYIVGKVLNSDLYIQRSHELAKEIPNWLTKQNYLVFGEAKPSNFRSPKDLPGIDLGYNVEETLVAAVLYAHETKNKELLTLLEKSLFGHLQFMLPDGAWDNSWGTRMYKWSYWGSRTTDGCQPAYIILANNTNAFGKAAYLNTKLLERCTSNGLIHGGIHFVSNGDLPCIHHTFCHAKAITTLLHQDEKLKYFQDLGVLPREKLDGVKYFIELDVCVMTYDNWTATVSAYDFEYAKDYQQATGGALSLLYHKRLGPIFAASMPKYRKVEAFNQQDSREKVDFALTPRVECYEGDVWQTNIYDRKALLDQKSDNEFSMVSTRTKLTNDQYETMLDGEFLIEYTLTRLGIKIKVKHLSDKTSERTFSLVLPVISTKSETYSKLSEKTFVIQKEQGKLSIQSNKNISIKPITKSRVFNLVPGMEAIPFYINFISEVEVNLSFSK